nr:E-beta-farnesene synthase [Tanacetum cinerariifolium]
RKHKFHPRPDSPLHLPNEEPVLGYLKFSAKGTKREVFGMPIPGSLITTDIQGESYYHEYLAKVAKHQRYLAGETGSDPDSHAPKPTKTAKKSKPTTPKADPRSPVSKPASSKQPKPKPAQAKTQGKKRKLTTEISNKPSKAKKSRPGSEPRVDDEEANVQWALKESLKSMYDVPRGPLPPMVIREPESEKYQPLLEVAGKGKEKVIEEQVAHDLLTLQTPKKRALEEESEEDVPEADAGVQGEGQAGPDPGAQDEGQARSNPDEQAEGQAGPDPGDAEASQPLPSPVVHAGSDLEHMDLDVVDVSTQPPPEQIDEGFTATAYPKVQKNLKLSVEEQVILKDLASSLGTLSSMKHLTKDLSFVDLFFSDKPSEANNDKATAETEAESMVSVTIKQDTSLIPPMTTSIIDLTSRHESPKVHQLLKATKTTTTILPPPSQQQQSTTDAMMMKRINIPYQVSKAIDEVVMDAVDWAMQAPLRNRFRDLPEADMKEILHQRMWETDSYKTHEDHMQLYEALKKSMNRDHSEELAKDLVEARKKKKNSHESPKTPLGSPPYQPPPPPPPPPAGSFRASGSPRASGSSQVPPPPPPSLSINQEDLQMDDDMAPDIHAQLSDDEEIGNDHIPKNNWASALASTYLPPPEDSLLAQTGDIAMFMEWFCKRQGITELKPQDLEGPAYEIIKVFHPNLIHLQYQINECHKLLTDSVDDSILRHNVSKPLPLGGPPGQVTIQSDFFFNKDLEYLRYGSKGSRPALSISKMKAAYYPDVGLEQMVPDQMWIEEECKYDIAAMYGISHWWFQIQRFYIDRHISEGDRRAVRTHIRILSVVIIEVFLMYEYDYMKKIVLRRADLNEHVIAKQDFKYLYPSDIEDLYLLNLQGHLNGLPPKDKKILTTTVNLWTRHLVIRQRVEDFQLGIGSYQTQLNLTKPRWDATGFENKHDYTAINSLRAVTFQDRYGV